MPITCGNRAKHNGTTGTHATVRACYLDPTTHACTWLTEVYTEDGLSAAECGALAWELPGGRGWACEAGHEHITAQARHDEGWDYAEDRDEAARLAKVGVASVQMDGRPWV